MRPPRPRSLLLWILIVAVVALRPKDDDTERPAATPAATATATPGTSAPDVKPTETPAPTVDPGPLLTGDKVTDIRVTKGDTVRFRVRSPEAEEVHVHTYDIKKELEPNVTATVSFKADITGIFEIEFEHSGEQIAELRVNPD